MIIDAYLVISKGGGLRVVKNRPYLNNNEIAITLKIEVPKVFFERLMPVVNIQLPNEAIINTNMEGVINISAVEIADKLNLEVLDVRDGLRQMIENKQGGGEQNG